MSNIKKKLKMAKILFRPAFGCLQHPTAVKNTQHLYHSSLMVTQVKNNFYSMEQLGLQQKPSLMVIQ